MSYIKGSERRQNLLFPSSLDEYVAEENPVRVIDASCADNGRASCAVRKLQTESKRSIMEQKKCAEDLCMRNILQVLPTLQSTAKQREQINDSLNYW